MSAFQQILTINTYPTKTGLKAIQATYWKKITQPVFFGSNFNRAFHTTG
jgi:hypothetical protein